jgi:hypothetical protein
LRAGARGRLRGGGGSADRELTGLCVDVAYVPDVHRDEGVVRAAKQKRTSMRRCRRDLRCTYRTGSTPRVVLNEPMDGSMVFLSARS